MTINYLGNLRCEAQHQRSGSKLTTDAPVDNNGKGEMFSPTDLLATSLVTCMITVMGIAAMKSGFELGDVESSVEKHMASGPRMVDRLAIKLILDKEYDAKEKRIIERAALDCPVALSLHPDLSQEVEFIYG